MIRSMFVCLIAIVSAQSVNAATIRVPQDHKSIQAAIDAANTGDTILVAPGKYQERIKLKPGVIVRSEGDDAKGTDGLKRAEATVIDGGGKDGKTPGVGCPRAARSMASRSPTSGLRRRPGRSTSTSHGEELGDEEGSVQAEGTTPAISVQGVTCTVTHCVIHHNGDVGIGILGKEKSKTAPLITENVVFRNMGGGIGVAEGAEPIIRGNICKENLRAGIGCRKANPIIGDNECFQNVRAGIGCREAAKPVIRGNKCHHNRRAGIGIRMEGAAPVVEANECYENDMAGIGCRDGASPILRNNVCCKNKMAGIGCNGAKPLIVGNECRENEQAGIGVQGKAVATIQRNKCVGNKLVAIGVTEASSATIADNELSRTGGQPPIIAVKGDSTARISDNRISGGGVAAVLVQGKATVSGNTFTGVGEKQGNAVWVWENSTATISDNSFDGCRAAVNASKATVVVTGNSIKNFQGTAIFVKDSQKPAHVYGNTAISPDPKAKVVDVQGPSGIIDENVVKKE
ncbi:MAG: right-handed parallel beta-helix repeat-containing protein [Gemmataceae bacterium]